MSSLTDALVARMNQLAGAVPVEAPPLDHVTTPAEENEANKIAAQAAVIDAKPVEPLIEHPKVDEPVEPSVPPPLAAAVATKFVNAGGYIIFFPRGTKRCTVPGWEQKATNNLEAALAWAAQDPFANVGIVGKQDGLWGLDDDAGLLGEYEAQHGTIQTYGTRTVSGGRHFIFRQNAESWTMGNVTVKDDQGRELLSARVDNRYVVAAGSWAYPNNDTTKPLTQYAAINPSAPFVEAPLSLLVFIKAKAAQYGEKPKGQEAAGEVRLYHEGGRNNALTKKAGKLREAGANEEEILATLTRLNAEQCVPPLPDSEVESIAKSVGRYAPGQDYSLDLNAGERGSAAGQQGTTPANQDEGPDVCVENGITYAVIPHSNGFRRIALDTSEVCARPVFPKWVMEGTSIFENLVKPAVEHSSKHAEFIFMPAVQAMMNYLSHKVTVELHQTPNLNLFIGLISPYGKFFKSSSCQLAHDYMRMAGLLTDSTRELKNSEGKVVIEQAGSAEGFMLGMQKLNAKCAVMFNDELGKLVSKAGIEGSSFSSDLLSWYGSAYVGNKVKNERQNFAFGAGSYTFGWLWCTTDRNFNHYWPKLAGISSGIQDRMFFLVSPEKPRPLSPSYRDPDLSGAKRTRELIDRAVTQGKFKLDDPLFEQHIAGLDDPRSLDLVKKLALYFAIDLGLGVIDEDCVERARALVDYRNQAAKFLQPIEAENAEGRLMQEIRREIRQHGGIMSHRELCRNMNADRAGRTWDLAYRLLKDAGTQAIVEFYAEQTPGKRKTRMVAIKIDDDDLPE